MVDQLVVDRPLSIDEFTYALKGIKKSSCPGCDGFSACFYVMFWGKIKDVYFEPYNMLWMRADYMALPDMQFYVYYKSLISHHYTYQILEGYPFSM